MSKLLVRHEKELSDWFLRNYRGLGFDRITSGPNKEGPDFTAIRNGKELRVELELRASGYKLHPPGHADMVVCVEKDVDLSLPTITPRGVNLVPFDDRDVGDLLSLHVLELLYQRPRHGYEIMKELERHVGIAPRPGIIYPFLKKLRHMGYIRYEVERVGRRSRKVYELTAEGRGLCARFSRQFSSLIEAAIEPHLNTCYQCGCKIYESGHVEFVRGQKLVFCCRYCAGSYKASRRRGK